MVGTTVQLVALACHYKGRVRGLHLAPFFPSNSTTEFCEYVRFIHQRRGWFGRTLEWTVTADTPDEWLARETRPERKAIICHHAVNDLRISDRMSAGFVGGGGRWRLNLVAEGRMDVRELTWEVGNREAPQQRIWRVKYALAVENAEAGDTNL